MALSTVSGNKIQRMNPRYLRNSALIFLPVCPASGMVDFTHADAGTIGGIQTDFKLRNGLKAGRLADKGNFLSRKRE